VAQRRHAEAPAGKPCSGRAIRVGMAATVTYSTRRPPRDRSGLERLSETIAEEPSSGDESSRATAGDEGNLQFEMFPQIEPANVESWLREAFEVRISVGRRIGYVGAPHAGHVDFFATQAGAACPVGPTPNRRSGDWTVGCWPFMYGLTRQARLFCPQDRLRSTFLPPFSPANFSSTTFLDDSRRRRTRAARFHGPHDAVGLTYGGRPRTA